LIGCNPERDDLAFGVDFGFHRLRESIQNRMPVILERRDYERAGNVRNNDAELLEQI
jgi:hypothetical protein